MANKTVTVRPSGGDYTSLSAAITGELSANSNLVTMDGILTIQIEGSWSSADTTRVIVDGFTTDSTRYVNIVTDSSNRFDGALDTGKYRLEATSGSLGTLTLQSNYTHVRGLQVRDTTGAGYASIQCPSGTGHVIDSCLSYSAGWNGFYLSGSTSADVLVNCVSRGSARPGFAIAVGTHRVYNCVSIHTGGTYHGFDVASGATMYGVNCYSGGNPGNDYNGAGTFNLTTCYSEDGTQSTSTATLNTSNFANVTSGSEDVALVSGSALIDSGTSLASDATFPFNWDCTGATRSGTWDVGAVEYIASGGGVTIPRIIHHLRMQGVAA